MATAGDTILETFRVRTVGLRAADLDQAEVASELARQFKIDDRRARTILKGRVVAKEISQQQARVLKTRLLKIGVLARVEKNDAVLPEAPKSAPNLDDFFRHLTRASTHIEKDARYHALAILMTAGCVLLPALYFLLVTGIFAALWAYIAMVPIHASAGGVVIWLTPILSGLMVAVFMLRPLFTPRGKLTRMEIDEPQAPALFSLVNHVSLLTGTPKPEKVFVDCETNAYVSSRAGARGFLQKRLELTIGMPLVYGMSTLQLASVLAHEFGHFSQTFEMFTSALVNRVNSWLRRCGWYKDPLELKLEAYCKDADNHFLMVPVYTSLWSIRAVSWMFRKLYMFSVRATQGLSQQMEFNADDHAVQVIGSEVFASLAQRVRELVHAQALVGQVNYGAYNENRLFNNLPAAIRELGDDLDEEIKTQINAEINASTTEYWSSHPADHERIQRAIAQKISNVGSGEISAKALFKDPEKLAHRVTLQSYTSDHGLTDASKCVVENQVILDIHKHQGEGEEAIAEFFGDAYSGHIFRFTERIEQQSDLPAAPGVLVNIHNEKRARLDDLFLSSIYAQAGIVFEPGTWDIDDHTPESLEAQMQETMKALREAEFKVMRVDQHFQVQISDLVGAANTRVRDLYEWCINIAMLNDDLEQLTRYANAMSSLLNTLSEHDVPALHSSLRDYEKHCIEVVNRLVVRLRKLANPLSTGMTQNAAGEPVAQSVTAFLATWGVAELGSKAAASHVREVATNTRNGIYFLYHRVLGELAQHCLALRN